MTEMDFNIRKQHPSFRCFATRNLFEPIKIQLKCVIIRLKCCREVTIRATAHGNNIFPPCLFIPWDTHQILLNLRVFAYTFSNEMRAKVIDHNRIVIHHRQRTFHGQLCKIRIPAFVPLTQRINMM